MCRIAGIIDYSSTSTLLNVDVQAMCDAMAHGGPDDQGIYTVNPHTVFGHRRLSIIDLSKAGHQPMLKEELTVTYNGEIYNYLDLRTALIELNYTFNTHSDTEVLLNGFKAWGTDLFAKLKGMFAFALNNKETNLTYLVRDQSGIKPLYYTTKGEKIIFASEVKAFEKTSYLFNENKDWKTYFLAFGHIPHPYTTLKDVYSLSGGSYLTFNHENKEIQINVFHHNNEQKTIQTEDKATAAILHSLKNAVTNHLIADAPIGVFLSGGIDSSLLTLIANQSIGKNLNTLAINFAEKQFSEEKYQKIIANLTEGKHESYRVKESDFNQHFAQIMQAMDQPTNDGINSWFVNKCAKENGLKAVLSGIGADELFGGYPSFKRMKLVSRLKKLPRFILKLAALLPSEKLNRIYYLSYHNPIGEYLFLRGFFIPKAIAKILSINKRDIDQLFENFPIHSELENLTGEERAAWFETNLFMKNQLLKDTDFMSMSHGIEVRVPFLDQEFLATTNKIYNTIRFTAKPKGLLINTFKNLLPNQIWNRPKMGFSFPLQEWFIKGGQITADSLYNNNAYSKLLIAKFKSGNLHWSKAFALYQVTINQK